MYLIRRFFEAGIYYSILADMDLAIEITEIWWLSK